MPEKLWFEPLIWTDYRLALLFTVLVPLMLLLWAMVQRNEAIQRLMTIYWRVASLLAITVYLMIATLPISFVSGLMGRILIPISLWFWVDLNEEINEQPPTSLKLTFRSWRWAVTIYSAIGAIAAIPFLNCAFAKSAINTRFCNVWFDPPLLFKQLIHPNTSTKFLGLLGFLGLLFYVICLSYFVLVRLGRQGRSALEP